ncbi:MAG: hypothetical protein FJ138_02750 [Deltaproteobacteria bacterium]|nr:hypothetical protein [Deltaproteobacteria bacterium]
MLAPSRPAPSRPARGALRRPLHSALLCALLCVPLCAPLVSCAENMDPATPDGALRAFALALAAGDAPATLSQLSPESRAALARLAALSAQTRAAVAAFPSEARAWAEREALAPWMTEAVAPGAEAALLALAFKGPWDALRAQPAEGVVQAFSARKVLHEDAQAGVARLRTRALPQVSLRREGGAWRVSALDEPLLAAAAAVERNLEALKANAEEVRRRVGLGLELPR